MDRNLRTFPSTPCSNTLSLSWTWCANRLPQSMCKHVSHNATIRVKMRLWDSIPSLLTHTHWNLVISVVMIQRKSVSMSSAPWSGLYPMSSTLRPCRTLHTLDSSRIYAAFWTLSHAMWWLMMTRWSILSRKVSISYRTLYQNVKVKEWLTLTWQCSLIRRRLLYLHTRAKPTSTPMTMKRQQAIIALTCQALTLSTIRIPACLTNQR